MFLFPQRGFFWVCWRLKEKTNLNEKKKKKKKKANTRRKRQKRLKDHGEQEPQEQEERRLQKEQAILQAEDVSIWTQSYPYSERVIFSIQSIFL